MFGVKMNLIWIQFPELDRLGLRELDYELLGENKISKSAPFRKKCDATISEKLFLSGLSEFQNIDAFKYDTAEDTTVSDCETAKEKEITVVKENLDSVKQSLTDKSADTSSDSKTEEHGSLSTKFKDRCDIPKPEERFDCHPENSSSQETCEARGCCWVPTKARIKPLHSETTYDPQSPVDIPYCYYPKDFPGYIVVSQEITKTGFKTWLERNSPSYYPRDVKRLVMDVEYENDIRLHIKVHILLVILKVLSQLSANDILTYCCHFYFSEKIILDISCQSSV